MRAIFKLRILIVLFLLIEAKLNAQPKNLLFSGFDSTVKLNFSGAGLSVDYLNKASANTSISHIEDAAGNIIFYVTINGFYNGSTGGVIPGSPSTAGMASAEVGICPKPGSPNKYYVFITNKNCYTIHYYIVDMSAGVNGVSSNLNQINLLNYSQGLELVKVPCEDKYWLLAYECGVGLTRFDIDVAGISQRQVIYYYNPPQFTNPYHRGWGELEYHNGKLGKAFGNSKVALIGDFNPYTGVFSNPLEITKPGIELLNGFYGLEFSPDGSKVYLSVLNEAMQSNLYQYDFNTNQLNDFILQSEFDNGYIGKYGLGQMEIGADERIYIIHNYGTQIHVIENPNSSIPSFSKITTKFVGGLSVSDPYVVNEIEAENFYFNNTCLGDSTHFSYLSLSCNVHTYSWNFGEPSSGSHNVSNIQNPSHQYSASGTYTVNLLIDAGTSLANTITNIVEIGNPHAFSLGNDTSICKYTSILCNGPILQGALYQWSNGDTNSFININASGNYFLAIYDNGCISKDTIRVSVLNNLTPSLGPDRYLCQGDSINLISSGISSLWSTGATNVSYVVVNSPGLYWAEIYNLGCLSRDSIQVFPPEVLNNILGNDTTICLGQSVDYSLDCYNCNPIWDNYNHANNHSITKTGIHTFQVQIGTCTIYDTVYLKTIVTPSIYLGSDIYICEGESVTLSVAPSTGTYIWSTGETHSPITVTDINSVSVLVSTPCGNASDFLSIIEYQYPESLLPEIIEVCNPINEKISTGIDNSNYNHIWSTGDNWSSIIVKDTGLYSVVINNNGCLTYDTISVKLLEFKDYEILPNIITPNGDGTNDYLYFENYEKCNLFSIQVYNRWGGEVAYSTNPMNCWDGGDYKSGVYYYLLKYTNPCEENTIIQREGFIQLIR